MDRIWLKSYPAGVPADVDWKTYKSIGALFEESVAKFKDRDAFHCMGKTITFGELDAKSRDFAAWLQSKGLQKGARVAIMMPNCLQYPVALFGTLRAGYTVVNVNPLYTPRELEHQLKDSGAKAIIVIENFASVLQQVKDAVPTKTVVLASMGDMLGFPKGTIVNYVVRKVKKMVPAYDLPQAERFNDVVAQGDGKPLKPFEVGHEDIAFLQYTGGTTGMPKGVVLEHRAAMLDFYKIASRWPFDEHYVYLHQTPMFHAASFGGVLTIPAVGGSTTYVPMFDPGAVLDVTERHGVSTTVMVPTMIQMLLDHPSFSPERFASMKVLTYGASPMPTVLLERLLSMFPDLKIFQGYGMTENCGLLTCLGPEEHRQGGDLLRSAGRTVPGSLVTIQDDDGNILPAGEVGEVCARAGNYMREYWNRPDETEAAFRGGWYHTGDAGRLDDRGYLYLVDRVKDMIVSGGENVYSSEVENAIASHEAVAQVAVIGIPSEQWGEAVHAIVVLNEGATATEDDLKAWAKERIAGYKIPKSVEFRDEPLPMSGAMKVLKKDLRAPYWEGRERMVQ